jgi:hypothetical protein
MELSRPPLVVAFEVSEKRKAIVADALAGVRSGGSASLGPRRTTPRALAAARAALVRVAIMARSFPASAATGGG